MQERDMPHEDIVDVAKIADLSESEANMVVRKLCERGVDEVSKLPFEQGENNLLHEPHIALALFIARVKGLKLPG